MVNQTLFQELHVNVDLPNSGAVHPCKPLRPRTRKPILTKRIQHLLHLVVISQRHHVITQKHLSSSPGYTRPDAKGLHRILAIVVSAFLINVKELGTPRLPPPTLQLLWLKRTKHAHIVGRRTTNLHTALNPTQNLLRHVLTLRAHSNREVSIKTKTIGRIVLCEGSLPMLWWVKAHKDVPALHRPTIHQSSSLSVKMRTIHPKKVLTELNKPPPIILSHLKQTRPTTVSSTRSLRNRIHIPSERRPPRPIHLIRLQLPPHPITRRSHHTPLMRQHLHIRLPLLIPRRLLLKPHQHLHARIRPTLQQLLLHPRRKLHLLQI